MHKGHRCGTCTQHLTENGFTRSQRLKTSLKTTVPWCEVDHRKNKTKIQSVLFLDGEPVCTTPHSINKRNSVSTLRGVPPVHDHRSKLLKATVLPASSQATSAIQRPVQVKKHECCLN